MSEQVEHWVSVDDDGYRRTAHVEYDDRGYTEVTRETLHGLLIRAGMRMVLDAEEEA